MSFTRADYPPLSTISYISTLTSVIFNPTSIAGGVLWIDASLFTQANNTDVTTWPSASGSYSLYMTGSGTVKTNILNGLPVISVSTAQNWSLSAGYTSAAYTFFFVSRQTGGTNQRVFIGNGNKLYGYWGGSKNSLYTEGWILNATPSDTAWDIYTIVRTSSGSGSFSRFGGSLITYGSSGAGMDGFYINTGGNHGNEKSDAQIAEVLIYNVDLSDANCRKIEGYLAWKWGLQANLTSGHIHASSGPSSSSSTLTSTVNLNFAGFNETISTILTSTAFSPTSITGCQLWLDGADATTVTGTTTVTAWNDKSGNGRNMGVGSGTTSYSANVIVLNSSYMFVRSAVDLSSFTAFIVVKNNSGSGNQVVFGAATNGSVDWSSADGFGLYMDGQTGIRLYGIGGSLNYTVNTSSATLFIFQSFGTTLSGWINGNAQTGATLSSARTNTASGFAIGGYWNGANYSQTGSASSSATASISEILVYNTVLTATQRQQVEGYLAWKWGLQASLPGGHLYLSANPSAITSSLATFYTPKPRFTLTVTPYYTAFNPIVLSTLALWIDGADPLGTGIVPTQGTLISSLKDKSGNNRAISTFSTTVGFPTYKTSANGSLGAIQLAAGNGLLISSISLTPSMSLYAVYLPLNPGSGIAIEQGVNALSTAGFLLTSVSTTSTIYAIGSGGATISATGGTVTTSGGFKYHVFTTSGTFTLGTAATISYLIVGGGGGGGDRHGAGGGAGGVLSSTWSGTPGTYTITVGLGGLRGATGEGGQTQSGTPSGAGSKGGDSSISSVATAYGGGGGGTLDGNPTDTLIGSGGGGGGGGLAGRAGTAGQGFAGGSGNNPGGGGGGGAGGAGVNADTGTGGIGTAAYSTQLLAVGYGTSFATSWAIGTSTYQTTPSTFLQSPIVGGVAYIAGGGGGNGGGSSPGGAGGAGGGGRGDWDDTNITGGTTNTGGGGGSTRSSNVNTVGRDGGSGLVLIWYPLTIVTTATGGTVTTSGGFKIHTFTTTGANSFTLTSPASITAQVLVVGGGGAGGSAYVGGGGGAGGAVFNASFTITAGTYTVTVGAGGVRTTAGVGYVGPSGANSSFSSITGTGGGGGGSYMNVAATNGGCGGGGPFNNGQFGTGSQGGNGAPYGTDGVGGYNCGGGGGGMGGTAPTPSGVRPSGGAGATYTVAGTAYTLAGGGGAGSDGQGGLGRDGGGLGGNGGQAGQTPSSGGDATPNTGSGGGGGGGNNGSLYGGAGGSGIVIIAYLA